MSPFATKDVSHIFIKAGKWDVQIWTEDSRFQGEMGVVRAVLNPSISLILGYPGKKTALTSVENLEREVSTSS